MVHTLCEILMPVGNSTWLLEQVWVLSVSNTVMYYKLINPISFEPGRAELIQRLDFLVIHYGPHSPLNFDACGKLNVVARVDFGFESP